MTQTRRDHHAKVAVGRRLKQLIEDHLRLRFESVAEALGYSTSSTLRQACAGTTFLSVEKLFFLANLASHDGMEKASIDWLLTGEGAPTRPVNLEANRRSSLEDRVKNAPLDLQRQIEAFLDFHLAIELRDRGDLSLPDRKLLD